MRKKNVKIVGVMFAMMLLTSSVCSTPVFAGTTEDRMYNADNDRLNSVFSNVTINQWEVAFATFRTVATKSQTTPTSDMISRGQSYYSVTSAFPIKYHMYFNNNTYVGDTKFVLGNTNLVYTIIPSGGPTSDVTKWPFPEMEGLEQTNTATRRSALKSILAQHNILDSHFVGGAQDHIWGVNPSTQNVIDKYNEGVLSWADEIQLSTPDAGYVYRNYQTDDNDHGYQISDFVIDDIAGKPGDKLEVKVYQFTSTTSGSSAGYDELPTPNRRTTRYAPDGVGNHVESGYIYIPYTLTYDSNGGGTDPMPDEYYTCDDKTVTVLGQGNMVKSDNQFLGWSESQTSLITDAANIPTDLKKAGSTFDITDDMTLYAVWADKDLVINDTKVPIYKRVVQNGEGTLPDMTFNFTFEQKSEWEGVSYVSTATPIGDKSITVTEADRYTGSDPYVGNLTGKKLYYGEYANVLSDFDPQAAGTYLYLVKEKVPATGALPNVTYTGSEYVLKIVVDANKEIVNIPTITLYKDSAGKKKTDYTTPPRVFDEKHELIFYNTYGTNGGTTPTGLMTNILPFIIIGGAGVGGLTLYVMYNVKRKRKEKY